MLYLPTSMRISLLASYFENTTYLNNSHCPLAHAVKWRLQVFNVTVGADEVWVLYKEKIYVYVITLGLGYTSSMYTNDYNKAKGLNFAKKRIRSVLLTLKGAGIWEAKTRYNGQAS